MKPFSLILFSLVLIQIAGHSQESESAGRKPPSKTDLRSWLENMVWHHRFSPAEIQSATGLSPREIEKALTEWKIGPDTRPARSENAPLLVLPYPGGRHPRIGFLDGAIRPQRETKVSVFTPWDPESYAVVDVPEALWSNLGLTYLAHTHVDTIWTKAGIALPRLEWKKSEAGYTMERKLPNGIVFGSRVHPTKTEVLMTMWLKNGSTKSLSDLRVQNCVMLKGMKGFEEQIEENKILQAPYAACHGPNKKRWIITAWTPNHRTWTNTPVPCLHADPRFPDCDPGESRILKGILSFYEGEDIEGELNRLKALDWDKGASSTPPKAN